MRTMSLYRHQMALLAMGLGMLLYAQPVARADQIHYYNGDFVRGNVIEVSGDIIRYQKGIGHTVSVRRMQLANHNDRVTTWKGDVYLGEVRFMSGLKMEIKTANGTKALWKPWVKNIELAAPLSGHVAYSTSPGAAMRQGQQGQTPRPAARLNDTDESVFGDNSDGSLREAKRPERSQYYRQDMPGMTTASGDRSWIQARPSTSTSSSSWSSSGASRSSTPSDPNKPVVNFPGPLN